MGQCDITDDLTMEILEILRIEVFPWLDRLQTALSSLPPAAEAGDRSQNVGLESFDPSIARLMKRTRMKRLGTAPCFRKDPTIGFWGLRRMS